MTLVIGLVIFVLASFLAPSAVVANVYPSGFKIADATVNESCEVLELRYVVNENADGDGTAPGLKIEVINSSSQVVRTVIKASVRKGVYTFLWDGRNDGGARVPNGNYTIRITTADNGYTAITQISDDNNWLLHFEQPRSLAINNHPSSPNYGRIYVNVTRTGTSASGRTTPGGLYILNADQSDALGQGDNSLTGGLTWGTDYVFSMRKIEIGEDENIYIGDDLDSNSNIYRVDPDVTASSGTAMLSGIGDTAGVHGSMVGSVIAEGSLGAGNLKLFSIDEDGAGAGTYNSLYRWDVNGGPIPYGGAPAYLDHQAPGWNQTDPGNTYYRGDLDKGPDGKFYLCQYEIDGAIPALYVLDTNGTTVLWNSLDATRALLGDPNAFDMLNWAMAIKVSPDGTKMTLIKDSMETFILPLNNGIPNLSQATSFQPFEYNSMDSSGTDAVFDTAGNIYVSDYRDGGEKVRIFGPPTGAHSNSTSSAQFTLSKSGSGGPTIATQPQDMSGYVADEVTFTVSATGNNLTYQWWKDSQIIQGATGASLTLTNLAAADNGSLIQVVVCDSNGVVVSRLATLSVTEPPPCHDPVVDWDGDDDVDQVDFGVWQSCFTHDDTIHNAGVCHCFDIEGNNKIDTTDFVTFERCWSGPTIAADKNCDNPL